MFLPKSVMHEIVLNAALKLCHRKEDRIEEYIINLEGYREPIDFPNLTYGLVKRGYSEEEIKGILGENILRMFERVCG